MRSLLCLALAACVPHKPPAAAPAGPPVAEVRPHVHVEHGVERPDPYYWLKDKADPAVRSYVEAENAWTAASTARLEPLRATLLAEMEARLAGDDDLPPVRVGRWWVQERYEDGADYPVVVRRVDRESPEELVVDLSVLAEGHDFFDGGVLAWSDDERLVAVAVDFEGDEIYDVRFRDLATGEWLPDVVADVTWSGGFASDGRSFLYTRTDEALRPCRVLRHVLGEEPSADALVYEEADRRFSVVLFKTRSERFFVIESQSYSTSEVRVLDAGATGPSRVLVPRRDGVLAHTDHQADGFLVLTDLCATDPAADCAPGFRLLRLPSDADDLSDGTEVIPHREGVTLQDVLAFADHTVVLERRDGAVHAVVLDGSGASREVQPPEPWYELEPDENPAYDATTFRFSYRSLVTPASIFTADLGTGALELLWQESVPDWHPTRFEVRRVWATSADGTSVPLTFVRGVDAPEGPGPVLMYGYGAYGTHVDPWFESERVSLLRRGVTFALCAVRGGGDLGRTWYLDGKLEHKQHTFDDFVGCAEYLVRAGLTTPDRLAIFGESAGGLLVGAVLNQRPDLFGAAIARVPFVDVVTTMLDDSIPLTAEEWEEWGDPHRKADFDWMLAYSPYDNVARRDYPPLLVTAGWNDTSVLYHEPAKWVARLRAENPGADLLLRTTMDAGHYGDSGRYGALEEQAFWQAWVLDRLGLATP